MKISKTSKLLTIAGITLASLLPLKNYAQKQDSLKKIYSENFQINLNDDKQYITMGNKEQGLKGIFQLNKTQKYEEAWLYLPSQEKWCEFGIESKINEVMISTARVKDILNENKKVCKCLFLRNEEIIYIIHNHPLSCKSGLSRGDLIALIKTNSELQNYDFKGIVVTDEGSIEYSLNPKEKEKLFKRDKKPLTNRKTKKLEKMSSSEISKFFDIKFTKFD